MLRRLSTALLLGSPRHWLHTATTSAAAAAAVSLSAPAASRRLVSPSGHPLFNKLLVANRGEIAVRVMRTAKRLGIPTVAVFSEADAAAVHARYADEAVCVVSCWGVLRRCVAAQAVHNPASYPQGPAPSTASYLNIPAIVTAIKQTGADAVHPGYGFLSENAAFVEAVEEAGAAFVGPPMYAVEKMGDKVESKKFAAAAKVGLQGSGLLRSMPARPTHADLVQVNTIPGWAGVTESVDHALAVAQDIGFPVMVKASAGGGGKASGGCKGTASLGGSLHVMHAGPHLAAGHACGVEREGAEGGL